MTGGVTFGLQRFAMQALIALFYLILVSNLWRYRQQPHQRCCEAGLHRAIGARAPLNTSNLAFSKSLIAMSIFP